MVSRTPFEQRVEESGLKIHKIREQLDILEARLELIKKAHEETQNEE